MKSIGRYLWRYLHGAKQQCMNWTGFIPSHRVRRFVYRTLGMRIGAKTTIYGGGEIRHPKMIEIGDGSIIGNGVILDGRKGISIGRNVNFSTGVWIWTVQHDFRCPDFGDSGGPVTIHDYAWLSCRAVILPGVTIGEGAVVAAGAVVTKDVEPYTVVAGVPAKAVAARPRGLRYDLGGAGYIPFI